MPQEEKGGAKKVEATNGPEKTNGNDVVIIDGMRCSPRLVVINEHYYPTPVPEPAPAPKTCYSPAPINVVNQQSVGGDSSFPNWVIGLIVAILLLLLAYGGYILYQSGKDSKEPAKTETVVKVINTGSPKTAIDPEARVSAAEANTKADIILQERESEKRAEAEAKEKEKNKESEKPDCSNNLADWLKF